VGLEVNINNKQIKKQNIMPLSGFDKASSSINKRKAARQKASQLRTSKIKEVNSERDAFNKIATKGQKRVNSRRGTDTYRKSVLNAQPKSPTTPESLQKINSPYVGFNPFGGMGEKPGSNGQLGNEIKERAKAKVVKTVASKAAKLKVDVSNKLTPSVSASKEANVEEYQKKGTMGKKKAPKLKLKAKAKRRKQKGSKAATLKKGFGY
jgi:hypothetical protein